MTVDGKPVELRVGMTVLEAARETASAVPTLCHVEGLHATGGCGVCVVEDAKAGRLLPACATRAEPDMAILTASSAALALRRAALELMLSSHPADCEAPCQMACPADLPVHELMDLVSEGAWDAAADLARRHPFVCEGVAPCEKACRRRPLGGAVSICALHRWLDGSGGAGGARGPTARARRSGFRSRLTGLTEEALLALAREAGSRRLDAESATGVTRDAAVYEARRCLRCGCLKATACGLRARCAESGARQTLPPAGCPTIARESGPDGFRFDSSRCVLCGLCARVSARLAARIGPTFHGRGFSARIGPPLTRTWADISGPTLDACVAVCPTGAMSRIKGLAVSRKSETAERAPLGSETGGR